MPLSPKQEFLFHQSSAYFHFNQFSINYKIRFKLIILFKKNNIDIIFYKIPSIICMLNKLCFGGLTNINTESLILRNKQIEDGFRIHTSLDYNKSLELIHLSYKETNIIPKVTAKTYYNSLNPEIKPINQIEKILDTLKFIPKDFHISVEGQYKKELDKKFFKFKDLAIKKFGVKKIFLDTYNLNYNYKFRENLNLYFPKNFLINNDIDSKLNSSFFCYSIFCKANKSFDILKKIYKIDNSLIQKVEKYYKNDFFKLNIIDFINSAKNNKYLYGITAVSNKKNYIDLINKIKNTNNEEINFFKKKKKELDNNIKEEIMKIKFKNKHRLLVKDSNLKSYPRRLQIFIKKFVNKPDWV
jgi:hypothetical protein